MPLFQVQKGQDAYVNYTSVVEADTIEEANEIAGSYEFDGEWIQTGTSEFDHSDVFADEAEPISGESAEEAMEALRRIYAPVLTYYIAYTDLNGDSRDLIVQATTAGGAFELWGDHYFQDDWISHRNDSLAGVGIDGILVEDSNCGDDDLRIFQLSESTGVPRALKWNHDDCKVVAWVEQS